MESILAFEEEQREFQQQEILSSSPSSPSPSSYSLKLVPWITWDEWLFVYHSLFSDSLHAVASALKRISTWGSRGCLPVTIEVTASIIEIQQRDPYFRKCQAIDASDQNRANQGSNVLLSDEMLAMLYCMAIMRLVNGVIEKTRKKREVSIAVAADAIGMPRTLIDIRHEGSHRELPALQIVRSASTKALDWLKSYYWEPQKKAIPFQGDSSTKIKAGIQSKLHELTFYLKAKESPQPASSPLQGKRGRKHEWFFGRNKFLSLAAGKFHPSESGGNRKLIKNVLKNLVGLYSSCSSEVVSVLLDFLLKALNSSNTMEHSEDTHVGPSIDTSLNEWKLVITKFSKKEPELLIALLNAVLDMIEIQEAMKYETGEPLISSNRSPDFHQVERLSSLLTWLVRILKELKHFRRKNSTAEAKSSLRDSTISKAALMQLIRKCLMLSASGNKQLMDSAFHIVQLIGDDHLMKRLNKLSSVVSLNSEIIDDDSSLINSNDLIHQDESISKAAKLLESIKHRRLKSKVANTTDGEVGISRRWVVAKWWNPCPIGMLPNSVGSTGCLSVLDSKDVQNKIPEISQATENLALNHNGETVEPSPTSDIPLFDNFAVNKRRRTAEENCISDGEDDWSPEVLEGWLDMGRGFRKKFGTGRVVWDKVEELLDLKSDC